LGSVEAEDSASVSLIEYSIIQFLIKVKALPRERKLESENLLYLLNVDVATSGLLNIVI
jgi:hypothetical protein